MSIQNRKLTEGTAIAIYESKYQTLLGKTYCLFKGHKKIKLIDKNYCICCWRELDN